MAPPRALLTAWLRVLNFARHSPSWYRARVVEELAERRDAHNSLHRVTETADVIFSLCRARHDGCPVHGVPAFTLQRQGLIYAVMVTKFTVRWMFWKALAWWCGKSDWKHVSEVVNYGKDEKVKQVAARWSIDPEKAVQVARRMRWVWVPIP